MKTWNRRPLVFVGPLEGIPLRADRFTGLATRGSICQRQAVTPSGGAASISVPVLLEGPNSGLRLGRQFDESMRPPVEGGEGEARMPVASPAQTPLRVHVPLRESRERQPPCPGTELGGHCPREAPLPATRHWSCEARWVRTTPTQVPRRLATSGVRQTTASYSGRRVGGGSVYGPRKPAINPCGSIDESAGQARGVILRLRPPV